MRSAHFRLVAVVLLASTTFYLRAQSPSSQATTKTDVDNVNASVEALSTMLTDTQHHLEETQQQLNELRVELEQIKHQRTLEAERLSSPVSAAATLAEEVERQKEAQEVLQAEVKQHDQTKLESVSKYPIRVYGLLLFNAFSNSGIVDNPDLPSVAIARTPGQSHGSIGGSFRQTLLGVTARGPRIFNARSSGDVSIDFFGDPSYNYYGSTNGNLRLRRGDLRLAWGERVGASNSTNEINLGIDAPLISPLSPTSFATVAIPALAWTGNLWTWAPELQFKHTSALSSNRWAESLQFEGGLWDPPAVGSDGSSSSRLLSAGETSRRPGYLGRASIHGGPRDRIFAIGLGGYSDRQSFYDGQQIQMWAVTSDWQIPIARRFNLDGEIYRGVGLGGMGGGAYKDTLSGISLETGLARTLGLNAVGGWAQFKSHLNRNNEVNFIYGQDGGFSSDFRQLNLTLNPYPLEQSARSEAIVTNLIYRPKTYLLFSPEYRHLLNWKISGPASVANIYTLSMGFQF